MQTDSGRQRGNYVVTAKDRDGRKLYWTGKEFTQYGEKPLCHYRAMHDAIRGAIRCSGLFTYLYDYKAEQIVEFENEYDCFVSIPNRE